MTTTNTLYSTYCPFLFRNTIKPIVQFGSVDPYDGGSSSTVESFRIINASVINDPEVDPLLSICIIQLRVGSRMPSLNLATSRVTHGKGGLFAFGFGSTVPNNHEDLHHMQAAEFVPLPDENQDVCTTNKIYQRLRLRRLPTDFKIYCMEPQKAKLSHYDSGAPLIDRKTKIVYGIAVNVFPESTIIDQFKDYPTIFIPILPFRKKIELTIRDMEKENGEL